MIYSLVQVLVIVLTYRRAGLLNGHLPMILTLPSIPTLPQQKQKYTSMA